MYRRSAARAKRRRQAGQKSPGERLGPVLAPAVVGPVGGDGPRLQLEWVSAALVRPDREGNSGFRPGRAIVHTKFALLPMPLLFYYHHVPADK